VERIRGAGEGQVLFYEFHLYSFLNELGDDLFKVDQVSRKTSME
jgi:hypothetical protein